MSLKRLIVFAAIGLFTVAVNAAQVIVPAAGAGKGTDYSNWQRDLMLHNAAPREITVNMSFHLGTEVKGPQPVKLPAKHTQQMLDFAKSVFGISSGSGALVIDLEDRDVKYLSVHSRTYNATVKPVTAEYGQGIPATNADDAVTAGQIAVLTNPTGTPVSIFRFNFGIYAIEPTTVRWELLRADGAVAASREMTYAAGQHAQHNSGVTDPAVLGTDPKSGDTLYARVLSGRAIVYGSSINQTGDPTFVSANTAREDVTINFSVDLNEDGTADLLDEDGDGVLDAPMVVYTSLYPAYFRILAESEFGDPVSLEVVSSEADAVFRDEIGTMRVGAAGDLKNKTGSIVIRATSEGTTALFTIPVRFK